jgi:hypothetical protein
VDKLKFPGVVGLMVVGLGLYAMFRRLEDNRKSEAGSV